MFITRNGPGQALTPTRRSPPRPLIALICSAAMLAALPLAGTSARAEGQGTGSAPTTEAIRQGTPFLPEKLDLLLPTTVYFQGRSAPLQLRNAAGTTFGQKAIVWAALVDSSGYSTSVQERYQFYLVTESALRFGNVHLAAGAYGGGYVGDRFVLMDLGGHSIGEGDTQTDAAFRRPRPLQMVADQPTAVKLYLGRRWVLLQTDSAQTPEK